MNDCLKRLDKKNSTVEFLPVSSPDSINSLKINKILENNKKSQFSGDFLGQSFKAIIHRPKIASFRFSSLFVTLHNKAKREGR